MHTEILKVNPIHPEPAIIERAAALIRRGEVVVFPTETVYGLGADAFQPGALERIFAAKGRPYSDPLIVHIADEESLQLLTFTVSARARLLAEAFWPGPLTLILPRGPRVPDLISAGLPTVAVRMPRHAVAQALIRAAGSPIAAPSANRFMHVSPTTAQHAFGDLAGRVPLILDGGPSEVGVESTVLNLCSPVPTILRPGGVSLESLRAVLPDVQPPLRQKVTSETVETEAEMEAQHLPASSPGQMLIHYAPSVPLLLFEGAPESMRIAMLDEARKRLAQGEQVGVLVADEDVDAFQDSDVHIHSLGSVEAPEQIAAELFAGMRALEASGVQVILCRSFDERGLGLAIRDRLLKAAGGKVFRSA